MTLKKTLLAFLCLALLLTATSLTAETWGGGGSGWFVYNGHTIYPWARWQGDRNDGTPEFSGNWYYEGGPGGGTFTATNKVGNTYYGTWRFVNPVPEGISDPAGTFQMTFDDENDTCWGTWDSYDATVYDAVLWGKTI